METQLDNKYNTPQEDTNHLSIKSFIILYYNPVLIHPNVVTADTRMRMVRILAPALSPVVTGASSPLKLSECVPALGSPLLVPPVAPVTGGGLSLMSSDETAAKTFICWP